MRLLVAVLIACSSVLLYSSPRAKAQDRYAVCNNSCLVQYWDYWCARPKIADAIATKSPCITIDQPRLGTLRALCTSHCNTMCAQYDPCAIAPTTPLVQW